MGRRGPYCTACRDTGEIKSHSTRVILGIKRTVIRRVACPCAISLDTDKMRIQRANK